jgi:epoxyqueuosine reductase
MSQDVCPFNVKFASALREPAFAPRQALGGKDARTLARNLLALSPPEFSAAFRGSPMKCARRRGLNRNVAVVPGNIGTADADVLARALDDPDPLVREHATLALERIDNRAEGAMRGARTRNPR